MSFKLGYGLIWCEMCRAEDFSKDLSKVLFNVNLSAEENIFLDIYEYSPHIEEAQRPAAKWLK